MYALIFPNKFNAHILISMVNIKNYLDVDAVADELPKHRPNEKCMIYGLRSSHTFDF